jgi:hypothetical protein
LIIHRAEHDVAPVRPRELCQLSAESDDLLDVLTPPDPIREVRPMVEELARLEKMQRRRVQVVLPQLRLETGLKPKPVTCYNQT